MTLIWDNNTKHFRHIPGKYRGEDEQVHKTFFRENPQCTIMDLQYPYYYPIGMSVEERRVIGDKVIGCQKRYEETWAKIINRNKKLDA